MNGIAIKLDNVSKRFNVYGRNIERIKGVIFGREPAEVKHALRNVSFEIKEGERVAVLGVVDSGRTTLAKIIAGITWPSKGKVETYGKSMNVMLEAKVGMDMEFSCRDNIFMKANIVGLTKEEIKPHVEEILEFAEVEQFADLPLKRAPKGTVTLLSMGVHLIKSTEILICDEVFGGGGKYITTKCENKVSEYLDNNKNVTAVFFTNRPGILKKVCDRAIVLDKGKVAFDGDITEATKRQSEISKSRGKGM